MWSVWSERVQVYLGASLVLVQRPRRALWQFKPPATLPLGDVLKHLDQACDRASSKPWRLQVCLSAAICPPVAFAVPAGVKRYNEILAIAQARAAQDWALPPSQAADVDCRLDLQHPGLAAALPPGVQQQILQWSREQRGRLDQLQPLWAVATQAPACKQGETRGVAVLEPDALTVLQLDSQNPAQALTRPAPQTPDEAQAQAKAWWAQAGAKALTDAVVMSFGQEPTRSVQPAWSSGPASWKTHWSKLS